MKRIALLTIVVGLGLSAVSNSPAQTVTTLYSFSGSDGWNPSGALTQGSDGSLYGTTQFGGASTNCDIGCGTVYRVSSTGTLTTLYSFGDMTSRGVVPQAGLVKGSDGNFYGTTSGGGTGTNSGGTVFRITTSGTLTTLYSFIGSDGAAPSAALALGGDGDFYGTTSVGGAGTNCEPGCGTVFRISSSGTLTALYSFGNDPSDGYFPAAGLVQGNDGNFYGTTSGGGADGELGNGTVFRITPSGTLTTLYSFGNTPSDGGEPQAGLVQGSDGNFYGTTVYGGENGLGTVFRISSNGTLTTLHSFNISDGDSPVDGLVQGSDGNFYGTTPTGGNTNLNYGLGYGTLFQITPSGTLTTLHSFTGSDGAYPGQLVQGSDGAFYGTTQEGGASDVGTVFKLVVSTGVDCTLSPALATNTIGTAHIVTATVTSNGIAVSGALVNFSIIAGPNLGQSGTATTSVSGKGSFTYTGTGGVGTDTIRAISLGATGTATKVWIAQACVTVTETVLHSFNNGDGADPEARVVEGSDGNFYGTTMTGGKTNLNNGFGYGTVFKITPSGVLTVLHSFSGSDGSFPVGLIEGIDGNFYGTTRQGTAGNGYGTVYRINSSGSFATIHSFNGFDGEEPWAELVLGSDGNFYGTTLVGGLNGGWGTVFQITSAGTLTTLHTFTITDGSHLQAKLAEGSDGYFYGTTSMGGTSQDCLGGCGSVFKISQAGTFTSLHSFSAADGAHPQAGLAEGSDGYFYGTTFGFPNGDGTVYKISPNGGFVNLHSFSQSVDGAWPQADLVQDNNGNLYGTTSVGGPGFLGVGTIFKITSEGGVTNLYTFGLTLGDSAAPQAGLFRGTDGNFYGTTFEGGTSTNCGGLTGCGTVFKVVISSGPCGGGGGGGGGSLSGTLSGVKQKCKTKNNVTICKLSAQLALLNAQPTAVSPMHVRFFLSTDATYDAGVDTQLSDATSKAIKPNKSGKLKLKTILSGSATGMFILAVDDDNNVLASTPVQ
jgi:uncharacterized repeat protein (TIGR03803 family)